MNSENGSARAALMVSPGRPIEVQEIPIPDLEPDSGLLRVELSEICGTDVHLQDGKLDGVPYPIIPGHVSAGHLAAIRGRLVDVDGNLLREGDRITFLDVHRTCNACWYCLVAKASTRCPSRRVYGITYGLADGLTGGWSTHLYLKPGTRCIPLEDLSVTGFMAGGCALPTALHAVDRAEVQLGETALVLGCGPVGLAAVIFARLSGARKVLCIGAPDSRLEVAQAVGASAVLNFEGLSEEERLHWVYEHTDCRGSDFCIEATGAREAVVQGMRWTRDAGRVVVVGQYTDSGDVEMNPHLDLNRKHLEIRGCWGSDFSHFYRGVKLLGDPEIGELFGRIPLQRYPLDQAQAALDAVRSGAVVKALVVPAGD